MKTLSLLFLFISSLLSSSAQKEVLSYPEAGKPMPDFVLRNIAYYPKKQATLQDFKGKWLILDFWNKYCGACIASFPTISAIQKNLGDKVQVMSVAIQDPENEIQRTYAKFREKQHLLMPCAFDSLIAQRFDIYVAPHIIIIDDKGIVRSVTSAVNTADMQGFLAGNAPTLPKTYRRMHDDTVQPDEHFTFDAEKPFLIANNGGSDTDFLFRSVLTQWNRNFHPQSAPSKIYNYNVEMGGFQALGVTLEWLYDYAFWGEGCLNGWSFKDSLHYGKIYPQPLLEIKDSSKFKYSYKNSKNIFSYSISVPHANCTMESLQTAIQKDLETYFGFDASIQTRKCPYWRIVAQPGAHKKLQAKGNKDTVEWIPHAGLIAKNHPYSKISEWLKSAIPGYVSDETGIEGNVDITLDCIPGDANDIQRALRLAGLDLVRAEKDMQVLVIKDKPRPTDQANALSSK